MTRTNYAPVRVRMRTHCVVLAAHRKQMRVCRVERRQIRQLPPRLARLAFNAPLQLLAGVKRSVGVVEERVIGFDVQAPANTQRVM